MEKSTIALIISALSLLLSFWNIFRDRSRLKVMGVLQEPSSNHAERKIFIKAMNKGRRPIYIRMIGGELMKHGWFGYHVGDSEFGCKLEEGQYYEIYWMGEDGLDQSVDYHDEFKNIFLEDSLGRRYKVPKSNQLLSKLKSSNKSIQPNADASAS